MGLNEQIDEEILKEIRSKRQESQKKLILITRRMKLHQKIYDNVRNNYLTIMHEYKKLDLLYALKTKVTIVASKKKKRIYKPRTRKNQMPSSVKKLLNNLPEEARKRIIAAYNS
jgi:ABC-type dipeptide/oligopeptide/nickel transport system ATPase component